MIGEFFLICFIFFMNNSYSLIWPTYESDSKEYCYKKAAVATDTAPCAAVGVDILRRNGSAVDAAIAMLICVGANNPQSSGLGGGFLMVYYNKTKRKSYFIDAKEVASRKAKIKHIFGPKAIAVPGELAGYEKAHSLYGQLPWKKLFTPTIKMCEEGILVSKHLENAIGILEPDEKIGKMFYKKGGEPYKAGDRIKMPKLAKTLKEISKIGKKALYGPSKMFKTFLRDLKTAGSQIDKVDFKRYKPRIRRPMQLQLRKNITLYTSIPPGSGKSLAKILGILDSYRDMNKNSTKNDDKAAKIMNRMIKLSKYGQKSTLEDSNLCKLKKKMRNTFKNSAARNHRCTKNKNLCENRHSSTTHISVLAPNGDAVAVTSSINSYFGSHVMSSSTGIIFNNQMADFSHNKSSKPNCVKGGRRPRSSMCPSIFTDAKGDVKLVIGAAGGPSIIPVVLQIATRILYFGESMKQSIDAPRFHNYGDLVTIETTFPEEMKKRLKRLGQNIVDDPMILSIAPGIKKVKRRRICANSDYRKDGAVDGLN